MYLCDGEIDMPIAVMHTNWYLLYLAQAQQRVLKGFAKTP